MSQDAPITFTGGSLPEGYCYPSTPQELFVKFFGLLSGYLPGTYNTFNYGNTTPDPNDRSKPWFRLDNSGNPDRWYVFNNGSWISPHPVPASSSLVVLWRGSLSDLKTFEGGVDEPVTATTGPFWEEVTGNQGKFPLHPGTLATDPATTVGVGDTGGEAEHELTVAELAEHNHAPNATYNKLLKVDGTGTIVNGDNTASQPNVTVAQSMVTAGEGEPHNNMPPYIGIYTIKRTARIYYKAG